jgi:hypothetical protein
MQTLAGLAEAPLGGGSASVSAAARYPRFRGDIGEGSLLLSEAGRTGPKLSPVDVVARGRIH